MALSYNFARTAYAAQDEQAREQEWPVVSTVILMTQVIGIPTITDKNINEVIARIRFLEALRGGLLTSRGKDVKVPESIIRSLVGLTTNAASQTWATFRSRIADNWHLDTLRKEG